MIPFGKITFDFLVTSNEQILDLEAIGFWFGAFSWEQVKADFPGEIVAPTKDDLGNGGDQMFIFWSRFQSKSFFKLVKAQFLLL